MNDERRLHSRIAFQSPARLVCNDEGIELAVVVLDLSLKGALLSLPIDAPIGDKALCTLQLFLDDANDADARISMQARVAHREGTKIGLVCVTLDLDSITHLRRLVELNLGDPALLDRELSALIAE